MPILILIIGILLVAAGINNKLSNLVSLVKSDFSSQAGTTPFQTWMIAIVLVGAIGYYKPARSLSNAFLVLVILAIVLTKSHNGLIEQATAAITGKAKS